MFLNLLSKTIKPFFTFSLALLLVSPQVCHAGLFDTVRSNVPGASNAVQTVQNATGRSGINSDTTAAGQAPSLNLANGYSDTNPTFPTNGGNYSLGQSGTFSGAGNAGSTNVDNFGMHTDSSHSGSVSHQASGGSGGPCGKTGLWGIQGGVPSVCEATKASGGGGIGGFNFGSVLGSSLGPLAVAGALAATLASGGGIQGLAAGLGGLAAGAAAQQAAAGLGNVASSAIGSAAGTVASGVISGNGVNAGDALRNAAIGAGISSVTGGRAVVAGSGSSAVGSISLPSAAQQVANIPTTQGAVDSAFHTVSSGSVHTPSSAGSGGTLYSGNVSGGAT
jgi:hypothetical protein